MKRELTWIGLAGLALAAALLAQSSGAQNGEKKAAADASAQAVERGKGIFSKKCAVCHYATSDAKKIGPGLKGLNKRGTFSINKNKVTDDSLRIWIENGDSLMPPFKEVLSSDEIRDVVRYVRTL